MRGSPPVRALRRAAHLSFALALGALVVSAGSCRDATEIVVDVRTDACSRAKNTAIVVGSKHEIESAQPTVFSRGQGCEIQDRIGTLTVFPRDAKDAEVSIKVMTGITKAAQECARDSAGCIIARRRAAFVPGRSQKLVVVMSLACLDKDCGPDLECAPTGACIDPDLVDDAGGIDLVPEDASSVDASVDAPGADAGGCDPATCTGGGRSCTGGVCEIRCGNGITCNGDVGCPPTSDCRVTCARAADCASIVCSTAGACEIACTDQESCPNVRCNAGRCALRCLERKSCAVVNVDAGSASIECGTFGGNDTPCKSASCAGGACSLACTGVGCGGTHKCCADTCSGPWDEVGANVCD
jgi:hypothetical protein